MGASALPVILFTLIWGGVAGSGYWVPEGPHKKLLQVGHMVTARGLVSVVCNHRRWVKIKFDGISNA